jgi:cell division septal protein FtsQ
MKQHHRLGVLVLLLVPAIGILAGIGLSPAVNVDHVTVIAPTQSLGEAVKEKLQVPRGASGLFYPLPRLTEQARQCYLVQDVTAERVSPHELRVTVTAREPFAALDDGAGFTIISREGICLQRAASARQLPVLVGLTTPQPPLGSQIQAEPMQWACELLAGADKVSLKAGLRGDFTRPDRVIVKTTDGLVAVMGNINSLTRKMTIVGRVAAALRAEGKVPVRIDVSLPETPVWTVK